ncbi:hypothetical protein HAX54_006339, partial [Datura stramonium]|nr:hypothetical protein [Datura stramonium]
QNWRCGMNRKPGYGAKLRANLDPTKGVGRFRQHHFGNWNEYNLNPLTRTHEPSGPRTSLTWACPATSLALGRHGHAPNVPRTWPAWTCAQRPSHSAGMDMRPATLALGRHGHAPQCPSPSADMDMRPAALALGRHGHAPQCTLHSAGMGMPPTSLALGRHGHAPSGPRTRPT